MAKVNCYHCHNGYNSKQIEEQCSSCNGSGKTYGYGGDSCTSCRGRGKRTVQKNDHCYYCGGMGYINQPDPKPTKNNVDKNQQSSPKKEEGVFSEAGASIGFLIVGGYLLSENAEIGEALIGGLIGGFLLGWTIKLILWGGLIYLFFQMLQTV